MSIDSLPSGTSHMRSRQGVSALLIAFLIIAFPYSAYAQSRPPLTTGESPAYSRAHQELIDFWLHNLGHQLPLIRVSAVRKLVELRALQAAKPIIGMVKDESSDVRRVAAHALGALQIEAALPQLKEMAKRDPDHFAKRSARNSVHAIEKAIEKREEEEEKVRNR